MLSIPSLTYLGEQDLIREWGNQVRLKTLRQPIMRQLSTGLIATSLAMGIASNASAQQSCPAEVLTAPIYWDKARLASVKSKLSVDGSEYRAAYNALITEADEALGHAPFSVTQKEVAGPTGDKRDYVSLSRYYWPNPKKSDGRPYIRKDGHTNPEINGVNFDRRRSQNMTEDVKALSLAAYFTGNQAYADKAKLLVKTWFLDEETGMNPHLKFAQNVPGALEGREFGILDGRIYWDVIDGMMLLQSTGMTDRAFINEMRGWFGKYVTWLVTSDFGKKAKGKKNNHGVYYDAQVAHLLMFAGRCDLAEKIIESGFKRTKDQIHKTGLMPHEKERTQSLFYHAFNLRAFLRLAYYGRKLDVDFYEKRKGKAGSVKDSVDFVASYAGRIQDWPYEEINSNVKKALWRMLSEAQLVDESKTIEEALGALNYIDAAALENLILAE